MSKHELGADRVLHEGAGYRDKYKFKSQKPPVGSRENPSKYNSAFHAVNVVKISRI